MFAQFPWQRKLKWMRARRELPRHPYSSCPGVKPRRVRRVTCNLDANLGDGDRPILDRGSAGHISFVAAQCDTRICLRGKKFSFIIGLRGRSPAELVAKMWPISGCQNPCPQALARSCAPPLYPLLCPAGLASALAGYHPLSCNTLRLTGCRAKIYVMATISEALAIAIQHHQGGRLQAAEQIYRQILAVEPNYVDAIHLLGVIAHQVGKQEMAVEYIRRAIVLKGDETAFHKNLGDVYHTLRRMPETVACYRRAIELKPDYAEAHSDLGNALKNQGKLEDAVACYRRALELKPDYAEAHYNLGNTFKDQGKLDEAVACYRRALELKPDFAEAHANLGVALEEIGDLRSVEDCFRTALRHNFRFAYAHYKLAELLGGKLPEKDLSAQRRLLAEMDLPNAQRLLLHFGLAAR